MDGNIVEKILEFLCKSDRPRSTGEVANYLGISTNSARYYLMRMHLDGKVELIKLTKRVWLWKAKKETYEHKG